VDDRGAGVLDVFHARLPRPRRAASAERRPSWKPERGCSRSPRPRGRRRRSTRPAETRRRGRPARAGPQARDNSALPAGRSRFGIDGDAAVAGRAGDTAMTRLARTATDPATRRRPRLSAPNGGSPQASSLHETILSLRVADEACTDRGLAHETSRSSYQIAASAGTCAPVEPYVPGACGHVRARRMRRRNAGGLEALLARTMRREHEADALEALGRRWCSEAARARRRAARDAARALRAGLVSLPRQPTRSAWLIELLPRFVALAVDGFTSLEAETEIWAEYMRETPDHRFRDVGAQLYPRARTDAGRAGAGQPGSATVENVARPRSASRGSQIDPKAARR